MDQFIPSKKRAAWNPSARPIRLKCAGNHVFGWSYASQGRVELVCTKALCQRPGKETRHIFDLETGASFSKFVDKQ